jgi:transcriptional regulator with XRE-family HTH domain
MTNTEILPPRSAALNERLILALAHSRARGLPAYQIAAQVGVSPAYLSRWASGQRRPSPQQAKRLARIVGVPADELFPNEIDPGVGAPRSMKANADAGGGRDGV